ncbi:hypothetical protein HY949_04885 [Candidatus Gottesmanbacteria bacterium]|nr:hypothetical protein [Candidatus Gottesmanbacteria bacterium]
MKHEQQTLPSSVFSDEALALSADLSRWVARHKKLAIVGTTAVALGMCSIGSLVVRTFTTEFIPDIHGSYLPKSIYIGSYSSCRPDKRFPGGPAVMQDNGGITISLWPNGVQVYHHAPTELFCVY